MNKKKMQIEKVQKVGESQPKGLHKIGTIYAKHAGKITKFNYMGSFKMVSMHFRKATCTSTMCP
jgi:hypothetical protein